MIGRRVLLAGLAAAPALRIHAAELAPGGHAITLLDRPKLPPDFAHFPYVNPAAPKGGEIALGALGTFDNYNPFVLRGVAPGGIARVWETLLVRAADEATVAYGHVAQRIALAEDHLSVTYTIRPEARFHDGQPITAEDVVFAFETLRDHGRPTFRQTWADVASATAEAPDRVVFRFKTIENRELPQIVGEIPILPKHWWAGRAFETPLTDPPLGSGPYRLGHAELGRTFTLERVPDWWAADQPTGRGLANFDRIRTEYFRDATVMMEAFKAGQIDFREENTAKTWATGYDFPALNAGLVRREQLPTTVPHGMQGFVINTRRPPFNNRRVRQALTLAFDFEWANKTLFYGAYTRTTSYFSGTEMASSGIPAGAELALLEPQRAMLPPELFTEPFTLPVTDGSGNNRAQLRAALALLREAGLQVQDRALTDPAGQPIRFEFLLPSPDYERIVLPYAQSLQKLGITCQVRTVDPAQYQRRIDTFDFDMTLLSFPAAEPPGNEQASFWSTASGQAEGGDNVVGAHDPVVDRLVGTVIGVMSHDALIAASRALDRVLLWSYYLVPNWHIEIARIAYWNRFARPAAPVRAGYDLDTWWLDATQAAATDAARHGHATPGG